MSATVTALSALDLACRVLLAVVFGWAALSKLAGRGSLHDLARTLPAFGVPPRWATPAVAALLAGAEALVVGLLAAAPAPAFLLAAALLLGFSAGIASALRSGRTVSCRCFGRGAAAIGPAHLVRNGLLLLAAGLGLAAVLAEPGGRPATPVAAASILAGLVLGGLAARWDDLVFILRGAPRPRHSSIARR
jgi:Methylamine utilisation protein MauE